MTNVIPQETVAFIYHYWKSQRLDYLSLDEAVVEMLQELRQEYTLGKLFESHRKYR